MLTESNPTNVLTGMFDFFDVTSLSSFRRKFYDYRLCPNPGKNGRRMWRLDGPSGADEGGSGFPSQCLVFSNDSMIMLIARARSGASENSIPTSSSGILNNNNNSNNKQRGEGPLQSTVQCEGVLRQKGSLADIVRIGTFEFDNVTVDQCNTDKNKQQQQGYGAIYTPRGEMFHGFFKNGTMWGPGVYVFPFSAGTTSQSNNDGTTYEERNIRRVRFRGMHNGKPKGLGCMTWSDGREEWGLFDGYELVRECDESECQGVVAVAEDNAEFAKRVVSEILDELKSGNPERKKHWEEYGGVLLQGLPLQ